MTTLADQVKNHFNTRDVKWWADAILRPRGHTYANLPDPYVNRWLTYVNGEPIDLASLAGVIGAPSGSSIEVVDGRDTRYMPDAPKMIEGATEGARPGGEWIVENRPRGLVLKIHNEKYFQNPEEPPYVVLKIKGARLDMFCENMNCRERAPDKRGRFFCGT